MASMSVPNNSPGGDREDSTAPLGGSRGAVHAPNATDPGDRRGGTMPLGGGAPAIQPPNRKFSVGHSSIPPGS